MGARGQVLVALACTFAAAMLCAPGWAKGPAPPVDGPATVALVIARDHHGRLTEELRRELEASRFLVLPVPRPPATAQGGVRAVAESLLGVGPRPVAGTSQVVAVLVPAEGGVVIYTAEAAAPRAAGAGVAPQGRGMSETEVRGEQTDRFSRRRLCLAVVERLRSHRRTSSGRITGCAGRCSNADSNAEPASGPAFGAH